MCLCRERKSILSASVYICMHVCIYIYVCIYIPSVYVYIYPLFHDALIEKITFDQPSTCKMQGLPSSLCPSWYTWRFPFQPKKNKAFITDVDPSSPLVGKDWEADDDDFSLADLDTNHIHQVFQDALHYHFIFGSEKSKLQITFKRVFWWSSSSLLCGKILCSRIYVVKV